MINFINKISNYTLSFLKIYCSDYFSIDNGRQSLITRHSVLDSTQASLGPEPSMTGMSKGCLSMADIVRMGTTSSQDTVSHNCNTSGGVSACGNSESSLPLPSQNHSEQQVFHDEWPATEQPIARNAQELNMSASSNANGPFEHPSLHVNAKDKREGKVLVIKQYNKERSRSHCHKLFNGHRFYYPPIGID